MFQLPHNANAALAALLLLIAGSACANDLNRASATAGVAQPAMQLKAGDTSRNDPQCNVGQPGLQANDGNEDADNGYGLYPDPGAFTGFVDQFTPSAYPATYDTVCVSFIARSGSGITSHPIDIVAYAADGPGGAPGTELGRTAVTANHFYEYSSNVYKQSFQAFDISSMNLNIASGSVYIGVIWEKLPGVGNSFYLAMDETSPAAVESWTWVNDDHWEETASANSAFTDHKASFIRAVQRQAAPPPATVASVPTLGEWALLLLAGLLGLIGVRRLAARGH